jgi:hypothetical protein
MNDRYGRRRFVQLAAGISALALPGCKTMARRGSEVQSSNKTRVREDVFELMKNDRSGNLAAYIKAIKKMRELPETKMRSWEYHAGIHEEFCPHGNWFFLPWHRAFLFYFEKVCAEMSGKDDFALPYWNWSANGGAVPKVFFENPDLDPGQWGDEYSSRYASADYTLNTDTVGPENVTTILNSPDFDMFHSGRCLTPQDGAGFQGTLEREPHNYVHVSVGGELEAMRSPRDPLFWLHHCNIDRLWGLWQERYPKITRPVDYPSEWQKQNPEPGPVLDAEYWVNYKLEQFVDMVKGKPVLTKAKIGDFLNIGELGYTFADFKPLDPKVYPATYSEAITWAPEVDPRPISERKNGYELRLEIYQSSDDVTGTKLADFQARFKRFSETPNDVETFRLELENVPFPAHDPGRTMKVYYAKRFYDANDDYKDELIFLGTVNFFGHGHHGGGTINAGFDMSEPAKREIRAKRDPFFGNHNDFVVRLYFVNRKGVVTLTEQDHEALSKITAKVTYTRGEV